MNILSVSQNYHSLIGGTEAYAQQVVYRLAKLVRMGSKWAYARNQINWTQLSAVSF